MAKKHKKHHHRRRVGAAGGGKKKTMLVKVAALAAGYLLADQINAQMGKYITTSAGTSSTGAAITVPNTKMIIGVEIGLGGLLLLKESDDTTGMVLTGVRGRMDRRGRE